MTMPPPPGQPPSGTPPPPTQPPGFGPPGSGGFGPSAHGGWPPVPPRRPNQGKLTAVVVAAVAALALIAVSVVLLTGAEDGEDKTAAKGGPSAPGTKPPSDEPGGKSSDSPADDGAATDFPAPGSENGLPSGGSEDEEVPLPSFMLQAGDCYDHSDKAGSVEKRECDSAHDAEVVSRKQITGDYDTDAAVRQKADSVCRSSLRNKAAKQPRGTVTGTLISYPKAKSAKAGISSVTCSLTAGKGKKLHRPLV